MIGRTLSHYEIVDRLGAGGMGEVYLARDLTLDRQVALKVLPAEVASEPELLRRLQREAKALAALDHPNIVTVFSVEEAEGTHFLTMAYVEGRPLSELIPPEGMPAGRLLELGVALADALRAAHERGIVHRDLKPGNVMVDDEGRLRVLDFGLARVEPAVPLSSQMPTRTFEQPMTRQGMVLGTIPYMSPEQAEGRWVDASSDLFSLGIVLYEMATGSRPFSGETGASLISSILRDTPPPVTEVRPELPEPLGPIVQRCLEKRPADRYSSALEVREALTDLRRKMAAGSELDRPRGSLRGRLGVAALALAGAVLVAGIVWTWKGLDRPAGETTDTVEVPAVQRIRSLAVLPLENASGRTNQEFFADGMTEALINDLSKIGSLTVIARSSSMRYKRTAATVAEIASELGVDAVVEGSVAREGDRVAIRVQLIDPTSARILWSKDDERSVTSLLALQREFARAIAGGIEVTLTPWERASLTVDRSVDPAAHEAYLKGRFHWYRFTPEDMVAARSYFELALEKDPDYALAWVGLADALSTPAHMGFEPPAGPFEEAKLAISRALELDPDLAEAHDLRARLAFAWDWDWEAADQGFRRAIELNPNLPDVYWVYSQFLAIVGRWDEVEERVRRAVELDPLNPAIRQQLWLRISWLGRHDEAIAGLDELVTSSGALPFVHRALWDTLFVAGRLDRALEEARLVYQRSGETELARTLETSASTAGYGGAMAALAKRMEDRARETYVSPVAVARLWAHAGDRERLLEWLERSFEAHNSSLVYVTVNPIFDAVRDEPRYREILRRMGLPEPSRPGRSDAA